MGDTYVPRFWPPFFTLAGSSTIFLGYFSHPPTAKLSFGVQKLPIFTKIDLFGPKFNFFLDLFGSNFQRPAAHPHQFSGRVTPPGPQVTNVYTWFVIFKSVWENIYDSISIGTGLQVFVYNDALIKCFNEPSRESTVASKRATQGDHPQVLFVQCQCGGRFSG